MGILLDVILAAIIAICTVLGWKKGFFRSIMKFGSVIVAALGAYFLNGYVSGFLKNTFIMPSVSKYITNSYDKIFGGMSLDSLFTELPEYFREWLGSYTTVEKAQSWYSTSSSVSEKSFCNYIASPIAEKISVVIAYILLFIVLFILVRLLCFFIDKCFSAPVLSSVNKLFGLILGFATGLLISWVAAEAMRFGVPELAKMYSVFDGADKNSIFLNVLCKFNPLTILDIFNK